MLLNMMSGEYNIVNMVWELKFKVLEFGLSIIYGFFGKWSGDPIQIPLLIQVSNSKFFYLDLKVEGGFVLN
jgi:hypothetical protein